LYLPKKELSGEDRDIISDIPSQEWKSYLCVLPIVD